MGGANETRFRRARPVSLIFALFVLAWCMQGAAAGREVAPPFTLPDLSGIERSLDDYRGQVVLLNFWATWCPPCRVEMPQFQDIYERYHEHGFVVVAVASDALGEPAVRPVADEMQLTFPVLLDPNSTVTRRYGVRVRPTTYFIGRDGRLVSRLVGPEDWADNVEIRRYIEDLLAGEKRTAVAQAGEIARPSREP